MDFSNFYLFEFYHNFSHQNHLDNLHSHCNGNYGEYIHQNGRRVPKLNIEGERPFLRKIKTTNRPRDKINSFLPCPFTGAKMFCAGPNFLSQPKNMTAFSASLKTFVPAQKPILLNANHLFVWHKMFVTATICK